MNMRLAGMLKQQSLALLSCSVIVDHGYLQREQSICAMSSGGIIFASCSVTSRYNMPLPFPVPLAQV